MKITNKHIINSIIATIILAALVYITSEESQEVSTINPPAEIAKINTPTAANKDITVPAEKIIEPAIPVVNTNTPPAINTESSSGFEQSMQQNKSSQNLNESLNQIQGETVTTEAIIERNAYFKKLSDQMKELQGAVSTESNENSNQAANQNPTDEDSDTSDVVNLDDEADVVDDPEAPPTNEELQQMLDESPE